MLNKPHSRVLAVPCPPAGEGGPFFMAEKVNIGKLKESLPVGTQVFMPFCKPHLAPGAYGAAGVIVSEIKVNAGLRSSCAKGLRVLHPVSYCF